MEIAIPLYDRFTALDAVGPYEVLSRLPGARVRFIAREAGPVTTDTGMLTLTAEASRGSIRTAWRKCPIASRTSPRLRKIRATL